MVEAYGVLDPALVDDATATYIPMVYDSAAQRFAKTWQIGEVKITKVVEWEGAQDLSWFIAQATPAELKKIAWLQPHFATRHGLARTSIHALVIETPTRRIIVDTCIGSDKPRSAMPAFDRMQTPFLEDLNAAGFPPESFDTVLCTHLHVDHVGWNTMLVDGEWVPTFPKARYLFSQTEYEYWVGGTDITDGGWDITQQETFADSLKPVLDAGQVDFIEAPYEVCPEVRLISTAGHSPGHVSVAIASGEHRALITGDICHHPCQLAHVDWSAFVDFDREMARRTRQKVLEDVAGQPILVIGTHFAGASSGYVHRDGNGFRMEV